MSNHTRMVYDIKKEKYGRNICEIYALLSGEWVAHNSVPGCDNKWNGG